VGGREKSFPPFGTRNPVQYKALLAPEKFLRFHPMRCVLYLVLEQEIIHDITINFTREKEGA
jgi:hypothetical protein